MNLPPNTSPADCDRYWDDADWLPPWYILNHWCQQDAPCRHAKQQALLSACERGEVHYQRRDGKTFDDPVHELLARGLLLIERASFDAWATKLDGKSPLPSKAPASASATRLLPRRPRACGWVTEPEVVLPLRQMSQIWEQLFPAERQRIVQLLIERVTLRDEAIEIVWRDDGWMTLAAEMRPGTIGAELIEHEEALA